MIPSNLEIKERVLMEAHMTSYSIHPDITKMYQNLKKGLWRECMKEILSHFLNDVSSCLQVKGKHQRPTGRLQDFSIPKWKWDDIDMDFVMGLQRKPNEKNFVWVIVDQLTKSAHFLLITNIDTLGKLT